jgi:hypothetical protein
MDLHDLVGSVINDVEVHADGISLYLSTGVILILLTAPGAGILEATETLQ